MKIVQRSLYIHTVSTVVTFCYSRLMYPPTPVFAGVCHITHRYINVCPQQELTSCLSYDQYGCGYIYFYFGLYPTWHCLFCCQIVPVLTIGSSFRLAPNTPVPHPILLSLEHFLSFWLYKVLPVILYFSYPALESAICPRTPGSFQWRMV